MIQRSLLALALLASLSACAAEPPAKPGQPAKTAAAKATAASPETQAAVRAAMAELVPDVEVGEIAPTPIPGLYQVAMEGRVVYVTDDGRYLLQGSLFDIQVRENLTEASEAVLRKGLLDAVGADRRIIFAAENPRHRITVFTDIDCGYCRRMHEQMAEYNALGITVEYLLYPRNGLGTESFEKAVSVWCAPDRRVALTEAKAGKTLPAGKCSNPVTRDYELGRRVGLDGTPAIYTQGGLQLGGYLEPTAMLKRLNEEAAKAAKR